MVAGRLGGNRRCTRHGRLFGFVNTIMFENKQKLTKNVCVFVAIRLLETASRRRGSSLELPIHGGPKSPP